MLSPVATRSLPQAPQTIRPGRCICNVWPALGCGFWGFFVPGVPFATSRAAGDRPVVRIGLRLLPLLRLPLPQFSAARGPTRLSTDPPSGSGEAGRSEWTITVTRTHAKGLRGGACAYLRPVVTQIQSGNSPTEPLVRILNAQPGSPPSPTR